MFLDFLVWFIEVAVIYVIPLAASLRVLKNPEADSLVQKRWLIHWVLVVALQYFVYPVVTYLTSDYFEYFLRLSIAFFLLFIHKILGNKISDLNDQFLAASSGVLDTVRSIVKSQLVRFDLVKTPQ